MGRYHKSSHLKELVSITPWWMDLCIGGMAAGTMLLLGEVSSSEVELQNSVIDMGQIFRPVFDIFAIIVFISFFAIAIKKKLSGDR